MASIRTLIAEDESIVAMEIQDRLDSFGYSVVDIVSSGEEAIQKAEEMRPDLVLMDIKLEGDMDGIQAAEQLRTRFNIPVVYLTAHSDDKTLQRAKITEPYGYILKPFEGKELHTTIEIALYRHQMEKKLRESERWLSTLLNSIGDAVIAADANGDVKFMNPVAQSLTGWRQEETIGKPMKDIFNVVNEETGEQMESPVTKVIQEGEAVGLANHTVLIAKDGMKIPIADSGAPIKDDKGSTIGVVLVFRDITEQRKVEQELQKVQKLESLGVLAGGIAHDFNNLLTGIVGNVSLAKIETHPEDKIYGRLMEMEKVSLEATNLTRQLLTFAKGGVPIKTTISIAGLIKDSADFALRGSNVRSEYFIPDDLWSVEVDEGQMNQVINNLIINAAQAMPEGGIIKARAENITVDGEDALPLEDGRYVKIEIEDGGIGIPEGHLPKIFDPYFTTKQTGSGLGLASAYSIIQRHNGYIAVGSELGVGTTFYIYETEDAAKLTIVGNGRILVMDDEEAVRDVVGDMLKYIGYEVELARDGAEAIEIYQKAKESGQAFDAVIMDLTIQGGMGGKEAIEKLIEIDADVKAIVSSGYSDNPVMANFRKYGFIGVVAKPYEVIGLSEVVNRVILDGNGKKRRIMV